MDPLRTRTRRAVRHCLAASTVFTAFAYVTAHVHGVRAGSPWQDDPYDAVVSFTLFLVPALAAATGLRALLLRGDAPQPAFRTAQLLRASALCTALIAATALADWTAVALRADHALWNRTTPWLIAALVLPTLAAVSAGVAIARAVRVTPHRPWRSEGGDWLDDLDPALRALTARLPGPAAQPLTRLLERAAFASGTGLARRHIVALAATAALTGGVLLALGQAVGEGWTDPLLALTAAVVGSGGFFAFAMLCNAALSIAVPREGGSSSPLGRASRHAWTAAAVAAPASVGFRGPLGPLVGDIDSVHAFAALVFVSGAVAGAVTFGVSCGLSAVRRQPGPTPPAGGAEPG